MSVLTVDSGTVGQYSGKVSALTVQLSKMQVRGGLIVKVHGKRRQADTPFSRSASVAADVTDGKDRCQSPDVSDSTSLTLLAPFWVSLGC